MAPSWAVRVSFSLAVLLGKYILVLNWTSRWTWHSPHTRDELCWCHASTGKESSCTTII